VLFICNKYNKYGNTNSLVNGLAKNVKNDKNRAIYFDSLAKNDKNAQKHCTLFKKILQI
jgi:hypothetical protein